MVSDNIFSCFPFEKKQVSMVGEIPQSHSADQATAYVKHVKPRGGTICGPMGII